MAKFIAILKGPLVGILVLLSLYFFASVMSLLLNEFDISSLTFTTHNLYPYYIKSIEFLLVSVFCFMIIMVVMSLENQNKDYRRKSDNPNRVYNGNTGQDNDEDQGKDQVSNHAMRSNNIDENDTTVLPLN